MFTPEMISLVTALAAIAKPVIEVICLWLKFAISKRYGVI